MPAKKNKPVKVHGHFRKLDSGKRVHVRPQVRHCVKKKSK